MNDLGPDIPNNWYLLGKAADLRRGQVASHTIGGRGVIVYRGQASGKAFAFDAHCVHMGCHLGTGIVRNDSLRCQLHYRLIGPDGGFAGHERCRLRQGTHPASEFMGGLFIHLGPGADDMPLAALDLEGNACYYAGEHRFALPWQALVANGLDIEHLSAVHDRALQEPPNIEKGSPREFQMRYRTRPTGDTLADRLTHWLATDGIHGSIRVLSGSMMLVESRVGKRRTFILLSFCPDGTGGTVVRGMVGVKGPPNLKNRISARIARALFRSFLYKDLRVLQGLQWHEPSEDVAPGDRAMRQVCAFFRSLPGV